MAESVSSPSNHIRVGARGLLRACAWCRRVRGCDGRWEASASGFLSERCTHGICDDCARLHFPEVHGPA